MGSFRKGNVAFSRYARKSSPKPSPKIDVQSCASEACPTPIGSGGFFVAKGLSDESYVSDSLLLTDRHALPMASQSHKNRPRTGKARSTAMVIAEVERGLLVSFIGFAALAKAARKRKCVHVIG